MRRFASVGSLLLMCLAPCAAETTGDSCTQLKGAIPAASIGLPLEVIAEYRTWRKVRDFEGTAGWMHQSMLSGRRTLIITAERSAVQQGPSAGSPVVAIAEGGVIGTILACPADQGLCRVEIGGREGWIGRDTFWGIRGAEVLE